MSSEKVELVKRLQPSGVDLVEYFSEGNTGLQSEEDAAFFDEAFEVRFIAHEAGSDQLFDGGAEGLVKGWWDWLEAFKSYFLETEDFIDAGDDVVVFARVRARTERDDVLVEHSPAAVWRFKEGKVVAIHFYLDRAEALESAGLPSEEFAQKSQ